MPESDFLFIDLNARQKSADIGLAFPGWKNGDERIAILAPHDDDAILGAGHIWQAAQAEGGEVYIVVFCDGSAGYSVMEDKEIIVARREKESAAAFGHLGVPSERIVRLMLPDFSALPYVGWKLPDGTIGSFGRLVPHLRSFGITRMVIPNGYREHIDHEATFRAGAYDAPQVGDPVVTEWGKAPPVRSVLQYAVWGDFSPEDAMLRGRPADLRADLLVLCRKGIAARIDESLARFESQQQIIAGLLEQRRARTAGDWSMEAYLRFDPRPPLDYGPYGEFVRGLL